MRSERAGRLERFPRFWNETRETQSRELREQHILQRLEAQIRHVWEHSPFYRRHYEAHGFKPTSFQSLDDYAAKVPVVTKQMLRDDQAQHPPFGSNAVANAEGIARVFGSSGTTGVPTLYALSKDDWSRAADVQAMALWGMGLRPGDLVQMMFPFSMFMGGWALLHGMEHLGASIFPIGAADSRRQIELIRLMRPTVLAATPSYVLHLGDVARTLGVDLRDSSVEILIVGGEPGGSVPGSVAAMRGIWGAEVIVCDSGNTSECFPPQMNSSCHLGTGMHVYEDETYLELVDAEDPSRCVAEGAFGGTVYTTLWRISQPMIRFFAGDRARLSYEPCGCGRSYPRLPEGLVGRIDDMLVIRGVNVYPSAIEAALRQIEGVGAEYRVVVERPGAMDEIRLEAEPDEIWLRRQADAQLATTRLHAAIADALRHDLGVRVDVRIVTPGTYEKMLFKARRVIDRRAMA
jgi:phenylacetate-CoA ligase